MKLKILRILTVASITILVLSPVLGLFAVIWQQHLAFINSINPEISYAQRAKYIAINITKHHLGISHILLFFALIYLNIITLVCYLYKKVKKEILQDSLYHENHEKFHRYYLDSEQSDLQKNIEMLERIWHR